MQAGSHSSLKSRVMRAGVWSLVGYGFNLLFRLGSNLVLTRLLAPEFFGLLAIATMVMVGIAMLTDFGLKQSVVQSKRGDDPEFLNTVWVTQIVRGLVLWLIALIVAAAIYIAHRSGLIAGRSVYAEPDLPFVLAALSPILVFGGFQSTKLYQAARNLALRRLIEIEIVTQAAGLICTVSWALIDRSVWAMVAGMLCTFGLSALLSHVWLPGVANRFRWNAAAAAEIHFIGKWIFLSSILGFLVGNGDRILLGAFLSSSMLGVYVLAFIMFSAVDQILSRIIAEIAFPALSEVARGRSAELQRRYYQFHALIAALSYFGAGVLLVLGDRIVQVLYDARYADAGWMLQILSVALLAAPFRIAIHCFIVLGKPQLMSSATAIRLVAMVVAIPLGFQVFGLPGAIWGIIASHLSMLPLVAYHSFRFGLFDYRKELALLLLFGLGVGVAMALEKVVILLLA